MNYKYEKELHVEIECDVLIVGGSQSGVAAAISCKRSNPKLDVHLIEQFGNLGGQSVNCMVCHWEFREYTNNKGQNIAEGIGKEMIERIVQKGNSDPLYQEWLNGEGPPFENYSDSRAFGDIPLDTEDIKLILQEMCEEEGVKIHLFTKLLDIHTQKINDKISPKIAIVTGIYEMYAIKAKIYIDCSANNDIAFKMLGEEKGVYISDEQVMPMQTYAWLGGVDIEKFILSIWENPDYWSMKYPDDKDQMLQHMREGKTLVIRGGADFIDQADDKYEGIMEELSEVCNPIIYFWLKPVKIYPIRTECNGEEKIYFDSTWAIEGPVSFLDQTKQNNIEQFMLSQLKGVHIMKKLHSVMPGWNKCYVERTATSMGLRRTRFLKGEYELSAEDVKTGIKHEDVIGRGSGHDVSRHFPEYEYGFDIPYRIIIPKDIDGLLVGARSPSCDPNEKALIGLNACRGISNTIIISQACGVAAALSLKNGVQPRDVDISQVQEILRKQNVILNTPIKR